MAKTPDAARTKTRKGKRSPGTTKAKPAEAATPTPKRGSKGGKPTRTGEAPAERSTKHAAEGDPKTAPPEAMPVVIGLAPVETAVALADRPAPKKKAAAKKPNGKVGKGAPARRPPRQTFLVAATLPDGEAATTLAVYAVVTRTAAEALASVRDLLGAQASVGLTGKLAGRMAKALGLKPGEVRRI